MSGSVDFAALEQTLTGVVAGARSLDEIEAWLRSRPGVRAVQLAGYLAKSNPPQRDFFVQFEGAAGAPVQKVVNVYDLGNGRFRFNQLRDR